MNRAVTSSQDRDKTPDAKNKQQYIHQYETRVTLKLSISPSEDPLAKIRQIIKELLREASQIDENISIMPWRSKSHLDSLPINSAPPDTVTRMHRFLHKLYIPKKGEQTQIYPCICIGHDIIFSNLRDDLLPWLSSNGHGLFYNMLQEEDRTEMGWLLYSTREIDAGALADEIIDAIGLNVGLRWKVINTGSKSISNESKTRALAVEVSAKVKTRATMKKLKLYCRKMKTVQEYPNGI